VELTAVYGGTPVREIRMRPHGGALIAAFTTPPNAIKL
jgi:hypothetical protein